MNELQVFNYEGSEVRTVQMDGEPWWVLKDVCGVLDLTTPARVSERLEDDEVSQTHIIDTIGRRQDTTIINESGLYNVIIRSDKPEAKKFKRWVTHEVLPSIRKHGMYAVDDLIADPDLAIKALTALKEEREKTKALRDTVAIQNQQILELTPKASYYDVVLNCKDTVAISVIAKDYGWSAKRLNHYLHDKGIQYKQGGKIWLLYQKYAERGYAQTKTQSYPGQNGEIHAKVHTYWTQQGRLFIYDLLKQDGILPLVEREDEAR